MYAQEAAGLCAPQINQSLQVAIIDMEMEGIITTCFPKLLVNQMKQ